MKYAKYITKTIGTSKALLAILLLFTSSLQTLDNLSTNPMFKKKSAQKSNADASIKSNATNSNGVPQTKMSAWRKVQALAKDTVVQLFVQVAEFNWKEPFKSPNQTKAWGSGFFIDEAGHIITNFHVINEATNIRIQIPSLGKEQSSVEIVGTNPERDIALLKLTEKSLGKIIEKLGRVPFIEFGDSDKVFRTQEIMALGYPLGQENLKSTQGIVSGRENVWGEFYIQITAAINPGNSGGPSLDKFGKVIGINSARFPSAQNVGYIIPINDVRAVINDLNHVKLLRRAELGCDVNYSNQEMVESLNNPEPGGIYISRIFKDSVLDKVGMKSGDMIYSINNHDVDLYGEMSVEWSEDKVPVIAMLNRMEIGQSLDVVFYRNGERKTVTFDLQPKKVLPIRRIYPEFEKVNFEIIGGMVVMPLTLNHIELFEEDCPFLIKYQQRENQYKPRLMVTHIFPGSQVQQARVIDAGVILEEVNGINVGSLEEFREAIKKSDKYLKIKTYEKQLMVLSVAKILAEEDELSERFVYKKSNLIKYLIEKK